MPNYRVLINDNARYMDESERADHGVFCDADGAIAACKEIVDDELNTMWKPGTTAKELYELYIAFGPDPFVVPHSPNDPDVEFSAWTYALQAQGRRNEARGLLAPIYSCFTEGLDTADLQQAKALLDQVN